VALALAADRAWADPPSRRGVPSKLFESIQAGVPVVASDWPEFRQVVEGYGAGVLCGSDGHREIGAAIRGVLEDRDAYQRMRENARRASGELNWSVESERLL
jgi:glycosyltransferase involved in cell wall biosynthesis